MVRYIVAASVLASLLVGPAAIAARSPTLSEREAITRTLPAFFRNAPVECLWVEIRLSKNPRYALADPAPLNWRKPGSRCLRYASNGFYVLRKTTRWKIIYEGSDPPPCSMRIPRDLVRCLR